MMAPLYTIMNRMRQLGWDDEWQAEMDALNEPQWFPARIAGTSRRHFIVLTDAGEEQAHLAGRFRHRAKDPAAIPVTGDWVAVERREDTDDLVIHHRLPRRNHLGRKVAGRTGEEQVLAANLTKLLIVSALDGGRSFLVPRLQRFVTLAKSGHTDPVFLVNKVDLSDDGGAMATGALKEAFPHIPAMVVSAETGEGLDRLLALAEPGSTLVFVGMSGVGKSSLVNRILGETRQSVGDVREEDRRGRHTTVTRELIEIPDRGWMIDTPGIRELQLIAVEDDLDAAFPEIAALAATCRFRDCGHGDEPGCAVRAAVEAGSIDSAAYGQYRELRKEQEALASRLKDQARKDRKREEKRQMRNFNRSYRQKDED